MLNINDGMSISDLNCLGIKKTRMSIPSSEIPEKVAWPAQKNHVLENHRVPMSISDLIFSELITMSMSMTDIDFHLYSK